MKWIIATIIGVAFITAVQLWNQPAAPHNQSLTASEKVGALYNMPKKEFQRRLKYHGLHKQISVVTCDGRSCWYRNAAGERCTF